MPARSRKNPAFTILGKAICPLAHATALGPVPDGIMKPQLAAIDAAIAINHGSAPVAATRPATTGSTPLAVATLLANSVIKMTKAVSAIAMITGCTTDSGSNASPSHTASPDCVMPAASARPPPNIIMTPQGALSASCHVSKGRPVPSGIRNSSSDPAIAMLPSVMPPLGSSGSNSRCPIHRPMTNRNIGTSRFSATDMGCALPMDARAASTSKLPAVTFCTRIRMNAHKGTPTITTGKP